MLQSIRDRLTGWVAGFIIAIIAIAFIFWGIDFGFFSRDYIAIVNGEKVSTFEYRNAYQNQVSQAQRSFRDELPPALLEQIKANTLEGLVRRELLSQRVTDEGYRVGDDVLMDSIRSMDAFLVGGEFSLDSYRARLSSVGRNPTQFEAEQRESLELGQIQGGIVESEFVTSSEARRFIELVEETREVATAVLQPEQFTADIQVSEEDLLAYYEKNKDNYMTPESVTLHYLEIRAEDLASDVEVDEGALREYYNSMRAKYTTVERRHVRHVLIEAGADEAAALARAQDVVRRLGEGEDFAAVAAAESDDIATSAEGGDLGWIDPDVFDDPLKSAIFSLPAGQVSDPVRSPFGFHVIRVDEIEPSVVREFADVRAEVEAEYRKNASAERYFERAETLAEQAFEHPGELDSAAEALGMEVQHLEGFTREGTGVFAGNTQVAEAAFSLPVLEDGENSQVIELEDSHAMVLRVSDHSMPQPKALDSVRDEIVQAIKRERAAEQARVAGAELLAKVEQGTSLEEAAAAIGATYTAPRFVGRGDRELPPRVLTAVFNALKPAGQPVGDGIALASGGYAVYVLSNVRPGQPDAMPSQMRVVGRQRMAAQMGQATFEAYVQDLRNRASVQTFQENAEQIPTQ